MPTFIYTDSAGRFKQDALMDDLIEALNVVPYVEGAPDGSTLKISVPDGVPQAAVDAAVAAHDPNLPSYAEIADAQAKSLEVAIKETDAHAIQQAIHAASDVEMLREATLALSDIVINLLAVAKGRM